MPGSFDQWQYGHSFHGVDHNEHRPSPMMPQPLAPTTSFRTSNLPMPPPIQTFMPPAQGPSQLPRIHQVTSGRDQQQPLQNSQKLNMGSMSKIGPLGGECEDQQCAEECDADECGDENRAPLIDKGPILPCLLASSTSAGAVCMIVLQVPLLKTLAGIGNGLPNFLYVTYVITMVCMAYAGLCDPGQLRRDHLQNMCPALEEGESRSGNMDKDEIDFGALPKRTHKTWLFRLPIRRYDHYCKWVRNCIGLLNHREFIIMCTGLMIISILGSVLDVLLLFYLLRAHMNSHQWVSFSITLLHFMYSVALLMLAAPILRLHVGFISRNELAAEWKRNIFYVVPGSRADEFIPVNDLSDDEFNEQFDSFIYDPSRNPYDQGCIQNCLLFWCIARCSQNQMGDF